MNGATSPTRSAMQAACNKTLPLATANRKQRQRFIDLISERKPSHRAAAGDALSDTTVDARDES
jgi:hypothetical protein